MSPHPTYSWRDKSPYTRLIYIRDIQQANQEVVKLRGPLGFDLEWRPNVIKGQPQNRVALIQLSDRNTILLIQLGVMAAFPSKLKELLENSHIVKAGVGIQYDCKKLSTDWNVAVRNCVDLSLLARCADNARWKGRYTDSIGLSRLVETYEQRSLSKGKAQRGNWEAQLSESQQNYAANDARCGFIIYSKLIRMARAMPVAPKSIYYSFDAINGQLYKPSGTPWTPDNPYYDPGPLPTRAQTSNTSRTSTKIAAPMSLIGSRFASPRTLEPGRRTLDQINPLNVRSGLFSTPNPPTVQMSSNRAGYPPYQQTRISSTSSLPLHDSFDAKYWPSYFDS